MKIGAAPDPGRYTLKPGEQVTDGPELQAVDDRCILPIGFNAGPVMLLLPNNSNYQIIQTADHVVILVEMIHDARIVRLNSQHRTDGQRPYLGDSIGWWEGDTLVVETTNFPPEQMFRGSWINLKVTERFTRMGETACSIGSPSKIRQSGISPGAVNTNSARPPVRSRSTHAAKARSRCLPCCLPPAAAKPPARSN